MKQFGKTICPECGAGNGLGAPYCAGCGLTLLRPGFAARPVDDDDDDEDEAPRRPAKKPTRPPESAVRKDAPPPKKKPAPRPIDDEEEEEDEAPRRPAKKKVSRRDEDDDEPEAEPQSMRDNTLLNLLFPVGVSIWAMSANYLGALSLLSVLFGGALAASMNIRIAGVILPIIGGVLGLLAILLGVLSFIIRPKKTTYGSVTGYMRAIVGIICGLIGLVGAPIVMYLLSQM